MHVSQQQVDFTRARQLKSFSSVFGCDDFVPSILQQLLKPHACHLFIVCNQNPKRQLLFWLFRAIGRSATQQPRNDVLVARLRERTGCELLERHLEIYDVGFGPEELRQCDQIFDQLDCLKRSARQSCYGERHFAGILIRRNLLKFRCGLINCG